MIRWRDSQSLVLCAITSLCLLAVILLAPTSTTESPDEPPTIIAAPSDPAPAVIAVTPPPPLKPDGTVGIYTSRGGVVWPGLYTTPSIPPPMARRMSRYLDGFRRCFHTALHRHRSIPQKHWVQFTVSPAGRVTVNNPTPGDRRGAAVCTENHIDTWRLPRPASRKAVAYTLEIHFMIID